MKLAWSEETVCGETRHVLRVDGEPYADVVHRDDGVHPAGWVIAGHGEEPSFGCIWYIASGAKSLLEDEAMGRE